MLSRWWTGNDEASVFWRASQSGGRATVRHRKGRKTQGHYGDVVSTDPNSAPFTQLITPELKRGYSKDSIHNLLDKPAHAKQQAVEKMIRQAKDASDKAGTPYWMLIMRRNMKVEFAFFPYKLYHALCVLNCFPKTPKPFLTLTAFVRGKSKKDQVKVQLVGMRLNHFLRSVDPGDIRILVHKLGV